MGLQHGLLLTSSHDESINLRTLEVSCIYLGIKHAVSC